MPKLAVIGAGITGVTTAYQLINRGYDVTLFERQRYAAMETSYANGGQLSASNAEVWNHWSSILKGIRWMVQPGAPLLLNPAPSLHKYAWMTEFLLAMREYRGNTVSTVRLALEARAELLRIAQAEGLDFALEQRGILHIYRQKKSYEHALKVNALLAEGGLEREAISADRVREIEPTVKGQLHGGFFTQSDMTGDIHEFTAQLASVCEAKGMGAEYNCTITGLKHLRDGQGVEVRTAQSGAARFDGVVVCSGVSSRALAAQLGDRLNVYPVKGYSITVNLRDACDRAAAPWVSLLDDETKIVASRLGEDRFRVAGTAEINGYSRDIRQARIDPLLDWCQELFPAMSTRSFVPWAGLRPMMPNMMPVVRAGRAPGVFYNTGHGHLGWTLSAATSALVADLVGTRMAA